MWTDTHCHIFSSEYDNVDEILSNLETYDLKRIIINGYNYETNQEVLKLVKKYPNVYGAIGLQPSEIEDADRIIKQIKENINESRIVAVGEIGLDYYWTKDNHEKQKEVFKEVLNIAKENNKPVIIHNRESTGDMLSILKEHNLKGIMHCFSGSYETAQEFIKLGYKLGIGGILTFKNSNLPKTLENIPISSLVLETDCPYITPEPHRMERNEPKYIAFTAKKMAETYNISEAELAEILEENICQILTFC